MLDSVALEVAIGLALLFLLLSLVASTLLELVTEAAQSRGRLLMQHLGRLLGEPAAVLLFADPRVTALSSGDRGWQGWQARRSARLLLGDATDTLLRQGLARIGAGGARLPSYLPETVFADVLLGWMDEPRSGQLLPPSSASIGAERVPLSEAALQRLDALYREADGDRARLHAALQVWFRQATDRLSGEFRRRARWRLLLIGLGLAALFDLSAVHTADRLHRDAQLREGLLDAAISLQQACDRGDLDCRGSEPPTATESDARTAQAPTLPLLSRELAQATAGLMRLPGDPAHGLRQVWTGQPGAPALEAILLGYLLSAVAVSLGANFWFAALQRLLRLKNARDPQATPPAEAGSGADRGSGNDGGRGLGTAALSTASERDDPPGLPGFSAGHEERIATAYWLARVSEWAYLDASALACDEGFRRCGLRIGAPLQGGDTQAYLLHDDQRRILVFRGTEANLEDVRTDLQVELIAPAWQPGTRVHAGFARSLDAIWGELLATLAASASEPAPPRALWITGHSLGGALAVLAAQRLLGESPEGLLSLAGVYTFGQPRVGDDAFAQAYDARLGARTYRYVNHCDVVPLLPPSLHVDRLRYRHLGQPRYLDSNGALNPRPAALVRFVDRLLPGSDQPAAGDLADWLKAKAREHVDDHRIRGYVEGLRRQPAVRALSATTTSAPT